jgi:methionyl-tRNA formyltransferase
MIIEILISDLRHPIMPFLIKWSLKYNNLNSHVSIFHNSIDLNGGDFLFLISCGEIISENDVAKFKNAFVLHASDLPEGKGWSPHIWNILEGKNILTVSLLTAASKLDMGDIWLKTQIDLEGHELFDEINKKIFEAELDLMSQVINLIDDIKPIKQLKTKSKYYPKRTPEDSRLDPNKTFIEQFNLLRVADKDRYPTFFEYLGRKYIVTIQKG